MPTPHFTVPPFLVRHHTILYNDLTNLSERTQAGIGQANAGHAPQFGAARGLDAIMAVLFRNLTFSAFMSAPCLHRPFF
jgi:hypothetical protein